MLLICTTDTPCTASRMESTGVKGSIHCSEETARLLPSRWLIEREEKIVAKGKGEMQTYFVTMSSTGLTDSIDQSVFSQVESVEATNEARGAASTTMTKENLVKLGIANFLMNENETQNEETQNEETQNVEPQVHHFQDEASLGSMDEVMEV